MVSKTRRLLLGAAIAAPIAAIVAAKPRAKAGAHDEYFRTLQSALQATGVNSVAELVAMGADPARVDIVPCGVDTALFTPDGVLEFPDVFPPGMN